MICSSSFLILASNSCLRDSPLLLGALLQALELGLRGVDLGLELCLGVVARLLPLLLELFVLALGGFDVALDLRILHVHPPAAIDHPAQSLHLRIDRQRPAFLDLRDDGVLAWRELPGDVVEELVADPGDVHIHQHSAEGTDGGARHHSGRPSDYPDQASQQHAAERAEGALLERIQDTHRAAFLLRQDGSFIDGDTALTIQLQQRPSAFICGFIVVENRYDVLAHFSYL